LNRPVKTHAKRRKREEEQKEVWAGGRARSFFFASSRLRVNPVPLRARAAMDVAHVEVYEARAEVGFPPCWRRRCESLQTARDPAAF
jgi:hypothetical protein